MFTDNYKTIKVIDLGISKGLYDETRNTKQGGTLRYMAPEQHDIKLTFKIDIW